MKPTGLASIADWAIPLSAHVGQQPRGLFKRAWQGPGYVLAHHAVKGGDGVVATLLAQVSEPGQATGNMWHLCG